MGINQLINSIRQIRCAEHVNFFSGVLRHFAWQTRRLRMKFPVELIISRSKIFVNEPDGVAALVNSMGLYDFNNMNLIKLFLKQSVGDTFLDVGANIGSYTLIASEVPSSIVVSFEPHPDTFNRLSRNIEMNKRNNVQLMNIAVSNHNGNVLLSDEGSQQSSINRVIESNETTNNIQVKSNTLDQICKQLNIYPHIVKIDVEGYESKVLKGFQNSISHTMILLIERGEKDDISKYLRSIDFVGPLYFHFFKKAFLTTPQKRAEDSVFINRNKIESLKKMGIYVPSK